MMGVHAAACGRIARDAELRQTRAGSVLAFSVAANHKPDEDTQWVRCSYWGDDRERLVTQLKKGAEVFVKGKLTLNTWVSNDGEEKAGLNLTAWEVTPLNLNTKAPRPRTQRRELARNAATGHPQPWQNDRRDDADDLTNVPF